MKAKLIMNKNTPKSSKGIFKSEFLRLVERFNKKFKGTGAKLKLKS